jgi:hypothetical protein
VDAAVNVEGRCGGMIQNALLVDHIYFINRERKTKKDTLTDTHTESERVREKER